MPKAPQTGAVDPLLESVGRALSVAFRLSDDEIVRRREARHSASKLMQMTVDRNKQCAESVRAFDECWARLQKDPRGGPIQASPEAWSRWLKALCHVESCQRCGNRVREARAPAPPTNDGLVSQIIRLGKMLEPVGLDKLESYDEAQIDAWYEESILKSSAGGKANSELAHSYFSEFLRDAIRTITDMFGVDCFVVYVRSPFSREFKMWCHHGVLQPETLYGPVDEWTKQPAGAVGDILRDVNSVFCADAIAWGRWDGERFCKRERIHAFYYLPVFCERHEAALFLNFRRPKSCLFDFERTIYQGIRLLVARALSHTLADLDSVANRWLLEFTRLNQAHRVVYHAFAKPTAKEALEYLSTEALAPAGVLANDPVWAWLTVLRDGELAVVSSNREKEVPPGKTIGVRQGITGWVYSAGTPALVNDIQEKPVWLSRFIEWTTETRHELALPITNGSTTIGVFNLESGQQKFEPEHVAGLYPLLRVASILLGSGQDLVPLSDHWSDVANEVKQLWSAMEAKSSVNDLGWINLYCRSLKNLMKADVVVAWLFDAESGSFSWGGCDGEGEDEHYLRTWAVPRRDGLSQKMFDEYRKEGTIRPRWVPDLKCREAKDVSPAVRSGGFQSVACHPLVFGYRFLGVCYAKYKQPHDFTPFERMALELLAKLLSDVLYIYVAFRELKTQPQLQNAVDYPKVVKLVDKRYTMRPVLSARQA